MLAVGGLSMWLHAAEVLANAADGVAARIGALQGL